MFPQISFKKQKKGPTSQRLVDYNIMINIILAIQFKSLISEITWNYHIRRDGTRSDLYEKV